jgi:hypothetical protein
MFFNVMDELTKGTAISGSQKDPAIFFNLKFPFKQEPRRLITNKPEKNNNKYLYFFIPNSLTFGKCKNNIEIKKGR